MTIDVRQVARVLVINDQGQTYLLRGRDATAPEREPFWFTPGGKIDPGETPAQAACRELREEIGLDVTPAQLGGIVGTEQSDYHFQGQSYRQNGVFFAYFSNSADLNCDGWSEIERQTIDMGKWWGLSDLLTTTETVYPTHLGELLKVAMTPNVEQVV